MMLSKYEQAGSVPSSDILLAPALALGVRTEYFFRSVNIDLKRVEHCNQHRWKLPKQGESKVLADVRDRVERWAALDTVVPALWSAQFLLPADLPAIVGQLATIDDIAVQVRKHWDLGLNPIPDLIDALEARGIKVFTRRFDDPRFEGMSARADHHDVVVVGRHWPGDRQRFSLAHELGRLIPDERLDDSIDKEAAADRFAGGFLVPVSKVEKSLGAHRSVLEVFELYLLKQEFGLSIAGWSYRARDLGIISKAAHSRFWRVLVSKGWNKTEPGDPYPSEQPRLSKQTVYRALSEELMSESKAVQLLAISVRNLAALRRMEIVDGNTRR